MPALLPVLAFIGLAYSVWYIWRSLTTGSLPNSPMWGDHPPPSRESAPIYFYICVALAACVAMMLPVLIVLRFFPPEASS